MSSGVGRHTREGRFRSTKNKVFISFLLEVPFKIIYILVLYIYSIPFSFTPLKKDPQTEPRPSFKNNLTILKRYAPLPKYNL